MGDHLCESFPFLLGEVNFHMRGMLPEKIQDLLARSSNDVMDLVNLVELVIAREQRAERQNFVHHAADAPDVHLVAVVTVCQQTLRSSVPARRDVLGQGLILIEASATAEIRELHSLAAEQDVLRLDVPVEDSVAVHVLYGFYQLIHIVLHALLRQVVRTSLDCLIHVLLHELEDESKPTRRLIVEDFDQLNYVGMRIQPLQGFDLS